MLELIYELVIVGTGVILASAYSLNTLVELFALSALIALFLIKTIGCDISIIHLIICESMIDIGDTWIKIGLIAVMCSLLNIACDQYQTSDKITVFVGLIILGTIINIVSIIVIEHIDHINTMAGLIMLSAMTELGPLMVEIGIIYCIINWYY